MAITISMFSWSSWPTPRSTLKWCDSVPAHHVRSSEKVRSEQINIRTTVNLPPLSVAEVYDGFVFGKASNEESPVVADGPNASSSRVCFSKDMMSPCTTYGTVQQPLLMSYDLTFQLYVARLKKWKVGS